MNVHKVPSIIALIVAILMILWRFPNWEYLNAKEEEYPGTKAGWFLATFMFVALPTFAAFKITQYAIKKTYGEEKKEQRIISAPLQLLEEAIKFFKEFYTETNWKPLLEAKQHLQKDDKQQALTKINEALAAMTSLRSKRAKEIKEKLENLIKQLEKP